MNACPERNLLHFFATGSRSSWAQGTASLTFGHAGHNYLRGPYRDAAATEPWIHLQEPETWHALGFFRRPQTRNAFRYLLLQVDPDELEAALWKWVTDGLGLQLSEDDLQAVSLDGKTLRGAFTEHQRAMHVLAILDQQTGCILNQTVMDPVTNEAKASLKMLTEMVVKGRVVVADAMFCQRDVCQEILDSGGDYYVIVKDNQPDPKNVTLSREVQNAFVESKAFSPSREEKVA